MKIYQYAAIYTPTEKEQEAGEKPKLIIDLKTVLAANDRVAGTMAARDIPEQYIEKLDQVEIFVRPF